MSDLQWISGFPNAGSILRSLDGTTLEKVALLLGPDAGYQTQEFVAIDGAGGIWAYHDHRDGSLTLQKSVDGGDTWTTVVDRVSLPGGAKAYSLGLVVLTFGRIVITAATAAGLPAVAYSDDNGASWTVVQVSSNARIYATSDLWVDQNGTLWACGAQWYDGTIYKSTNLGATWSQVVVGSPPMGAPNYDLAMLGIANGVLFLVVSGPEGGIDPDFSHLAASLDGGTTWTWTLSTGDAGWQTAGRAPVAWDSVHGMYVTVSNSHSFTSPDGIVWTQGPALPAQCVGGCFHNGTVLMALADRSGTGNQNFSYWESSDGGTTWTQNSAMLPNYSDLQGFTSGDSQWADPATHLAFTTFPTAIASDSDPNVIGQTAFSVTVGALNPDNSVDTTYTGARVMVYADDGAGNFPFQIGAGTFQNGLASVSCSPLTTVYGTNGINGTRLLKAIDTNQKTSAPFNIAIYFNVWFRLETCMHCINDTILGYCENPAGTACDHTKLPPNSVFIALPYVASQSPCFLSIRITTTTSASGPLVQTTVHDRGPVLDNNYWNTGNYMLVNNGRWGCVSDGLADLLGIPHGCGPDGHAFGDSPVYWRFA